MDMDTNAHMDAHTGGYPNIMIRFIINFLKYLLPRRRLKSKLPLLPLQYSSTSGMKVDPQKRRDIDFIKGHGLARTDQDAMRLLSKYAGQSVHQIISNTKRQRRRKQRIVMALSRLKRLWERG
jgi:hypothetical protein